MMASIDNFLHDAFVPNLFMNAPEIAPVLRRLFPTWRPTASVSGVTLAEGNGGTRPFTFTVALSAASGQTVTVDYATANGTADGMDYQAVSGTLTFLPGETAKTVTVRVNGDRAYESDETFFVNLSGATNATLVRSQGIGTIRNDDAKPLVAAGAAAGGNGTVAVYDGQTGGLIRQSAPFGNYPGGIHVATGDVNGDGYADLILMGGPGAQLGHVQIQSGRPLDAFSLLADYRLPKVFGELNVAAGDVNGDGRADVVVSTATKFDYVAVFDGATQNRIAAYSVFGGLRIGVSLAVGDFDGDGKADVIAGTATRVAALGGKGAAVVVNGLTGARLVSPGFPGAFLFPLKTNGVSVAAGDVNGDGLADVAIGSLSPIGGLGPVVGVFDAAGKGLLNGFLPAPGKQVGVRLSSTDRDGDGRDEILATFTGGTPIGAYYTYNPATNSFTVLDGFFVGIAPRPAACTSPAASDCKRSPVRTPELLEPGLAKVGSGVTPRSSRTSPPPVRRGSIKSSGSSLKSWPCKPTRHHRSVRAGPTRN